MNLIRTEENQFVIEDIHQALKNKFSYINFDAMEHRYFNDKDEEYLSVSSILEKFIVPFNLEYHSKKVAQRENIPQDELKTIWDIRRNFSIVKGTEFHLYVQTFLNENREIEILTPIKKQVEDFHQFWNKNRNKYEVVATEVIIADDDLKIAGTVDCIVRHIPSNNFFIFDWKTNQKIREKNPVAQKMLAPFNHLDHCDLNKYSMQMSFYKYLINKNTSLEIKNAYLIHFPPQLDYKVHIVKDFSKEVEEAIIKIKEK